jgi:hypothetical protein
MGGRRDVAPPWVVRMRTILRFANSARVGAGLRELIARLSNGWSCYKSGGRGQGRSRAPRLGAMTPHNDPIVGPAPRVG